ncbi:MAG: efflux RND transporter periplasmic adaptor subunit [Methylovulum sp.]|jgi:membrane fusion protein (multidrug efflux system)|nr:efflux RND transporter periplasmic adaptor subunit [Methylovulum sp.]MCF7999194.1 efflux RND transporter periplasmic adaptor subunit [Methylovulum sp.]
MIKRMLMMLITVSLVLGGVFGFIAFKGRMIKQFMTAQGEPPQTVSTLTASTEAWQAELKAVATLHAVQGVELSTEVSGLVSAIYFKQGDQVAANTPLLQLRADNDNAKLKSLNAAASLAQITYQRSEGQYKANAISKQTLDADKANLDMALAAVAEQQALLDKKTLRAPFTGQLGIRHVDLGQFLNAGNRIATLQALDSLYVDFFLPQQAISSLKTGQAVKVQTDAYPKKVFTGEISVINPQVDLETRNILVRATLNNPKHQLLPGMYATTTIQVDQPQRYITLPRSVISFNSFGSTVYLIDKTDPNKQIAKQSFVTTGATRGDQIAILSGVNEGDWVVTSGQIKLHNGSPVLIDNAVQPSNDAAPQPIDH